MTQQNKIQLFEQKQVRTLWDDEKEEWYFSIIDVVEVLTDSPRPRKYWSAIKTKLKDEGSEEGVQFASLTDIIYKTWSDHSDKEYKRLKNLKKENLRDNMTNAELVLNMLAELSTKNISEAIDPQTMQEHAQAAKQGGKIARNARMELEAKSGKKVVTSLNAKSIQQSLELKEDKE